MPGFGSADRVDAARAGRPCSSELGDRLGASLRLVVDAVDEERAQRLVRRDARDDQPDRGERDDDGEQARPQRHGAYDSRSA